LQWEESWEKETEGPKKVEQGHSGKGLRLYPPGI
jgi:hypothetical protein